MNTQYGTTKQAVIEIYKQYVASRRQNPVQTAEEINRAIGGITAVHFNARNRFSIANHNFCVSLPYRGQGKRDKPIFALAYAGYLRAQQNGSRRPGEVHAGRSMSTKHHAQGLTALLN
jgi:hypothetical protein